ncbi:MAG TPA: hypothetical protein DIT29_03425 [Pseudothermotoga sp.]|nr:hypothetical protein [Pseudothermotoga sp.]HCO97756.1 hypothetical protein [Pseudothermotoga sp.]
MKKYRMEALLAALVLFTSLAVVMTVRCSRPFETSALAELLQEFLRKRNPTFVKGFNMREKRWATRV